MWTARLCLPLPACIKKYARGYFLETELQVALEKFTSCLHKTFPEHKIKIDDRHESVKTISSAEIDSRIFPNWEMGFATGDDLQPLKWKWDLDKLSLFSLVEEIEDSMDLIKTFIGSRNLAQKIPT